MHARELARRGSTSPTILERRKQYILLSVVELKDVRAQFGVVLFPSQEALSLECA